MIIIIIHYYYSTEAKYPESNRITVEHVYQWNALLMLTSLIIKTLITSVLNPVHLTLLHTDKHSVSHTHTHTHTHTRTRTHTYLIINTSRFANSYKPCGETVIQ